MSFQIEEPNQKSKKSFSLFALGFRPFFLFAAFFAPLLIALWALQLSGYLSISSYYSPTGWHAHEMLFGYTVAVIAGFILTATGNWTGMKMISGWQLALLSVVFLAGRLAPFVTSLSYQMIAAIDLAFIPLVAFLVAVPVIKAKQWSNIIFVPLLLAMATANFAVHASALGWSDLSIITGSRAMLYLVVFLIVVMGGRVIPFFTERGVAGVTTKKWPAIEWLSPISILLLILSDVMYGDKIFTAYVALFTAVVHGIRLAGWYSAKIWQVPLVWVLQIAYAWFIVGFIIKALALIEFNQSLFAYHAFTVGGIGIMTLGMMARVSLGHTGREMNLNSWMVFSFILINVAAFFRVILPMFMHEYYLQLIKVSAWLWVVAFIIYLVVYTPMWLKPRVDGRPG
ncbi:MAG: NnrS family protein [Woeseiaceae bacterium]